MTDKKLTDSEIVKALEEAIEYGCGHYIEIEMPTIKNALDLINRLQAENDTLRTCVKQIPLIRKDGKSPLSLLTAEIKAEAYKEFAERLKEKATDIGVCDAHGNNYGGATVVLTNDIDNLLKELVGDEP